MLVSRTALNLMLAEARRAHPHECCGLLLGDSGGIAEVRPADNVHPDPARFFTIDPQAVFDAHRGSRDGGPELLGYYHSHPVGRPEPSATDRAHATQDGRVWAIIGQGRVGFWRDAKQGFEPLSYTPFDG